MSIGEGHHDHGHGHDHEHGHGHGHGADDDHDDGVEVPLEDNPIWQQDNVVLHSVGVDIGSSIDLAWLDDLTVAVLGEGGGDVPNELWFVEVGGLTTATKATTGAVDITAREQARSLIVVDGSQQVFTRSGTGWAKVTSGPSELAYSG